MKKEKNGTHKKKKDKTNHPLFRRKKGGETKVRFVEDEKTGHPGKKYKNWGVLGWEVRKGKERDKLGKGSWGNGLNYLRGHSKTVAKEREGRPGERIKKDRRPKSRGVQISSGSGAGKGKL